jgi:hypothetical protein
MSEVRKIVIAGHPCLAVSTFRSDGWRVAGFYRELSVIVEEQISEDQAFESWKLKALSARGPAALSAPAESQLAGALRYCVENLLQLPPAAAGTGDLSPEQAGASQDPQQAG